MTIRLLFRLIRRTAALSLLGVAAASSRTPAAFAGRPMGRDHHGERRRRAVHVRDRGKRPDLERIFLQRRATDTFDRCKRRENDWLNSFDQYAATLGPLVTESWPASTGGAPARPTHSRPARAATRSPDGAAGPSIDGTWILQAKSSKGESAWRFIARQKAAPCRRASCASTATPAR